MTTNAEDAVLLRRYAKEAAEDAFAELVHRYFDLVWSAAWRVTLDADLARDVAQTVFVDLARKAGGLSESVILAGWLYRAASLAARKVVRNNVRRSERERKSMEIESGSLSVSTPDPDAESLLPLLDEALGKLAEADRNALVLRFFRQKNFVEVGAALGVSDDAAQKRLSRALEKLRRYFRSRGLAVSTGGIAGILGVAGAQAAPAGLSLAITSSSLALANSVTTPGIIAFASKLQTQLTIMKTKLAILALATVGVSAPIALQQRTINALQQNNRALQNRAGGLADLRAENQQLLGRQADFDELQRLRRDHDELIALQDEVERRRMNGADAGLYNEWRRAEEDLHAAQGKRAQVDAEIRSKWLNANTVDALKNIGLAARIFATSNHDRFPTNFDEMKDELPAKFKGGLELDQFEFVQHRRPVKEAEPQLMLFREKTARQLPDGTWTKAVVLCDGSVQQHISQDGNFDEWENQMIAHETNSTATK